MADGRADQRLNKELNFSFCEEDTEKGAQKTAGGGAAEAQSQKSERDRDEEPEGPKSPPRDELYPSQNREKESPGPSLWIPVSSLPKCPETPKPHSKDRMPVNDNLSTPKVSKPW